MADQRNEEGGFTLIELVVVVAVLPIIVGGLTAALLAIISFQPSISNRLSDSGDALVTSGYFQKDVATAQTVTTDATSTNPSPCGAGTQLLGLQNGTGTQVSYSVVTSQNTGGATLQNIQRNVCTGGTVTSAVIVSENVANPATGSGLPVATVNCVATTPTNPTCAGTPPAYQTGWEPVSGVQNISFPIEELSSQYTESLVAAPSAGTNADSNTSTAAPAYNCGFAEAGTGTYASNLCFMDFTPYNTDTGTPCANGAGLQITEGITNTPFTMSMCLQTSGGPVAGAAIPTYTDSGSAAYLGNNGFYTGIPGNPALYQTTEGTKSTITITNIQVIGTGGQPATNWQLVTGDAESTDQGESITWTAGWSAGSTVSAANQVWTMVPDSTNSAMGNACANPTPGSGTTPGNGFTGAGTNVVECQASVSSVKTGTAIIAAPEPTSLTAYMVGTGLQAVFVGLLLPS